MREKKLQIFVSSTFTDLRLERQAAVEAILSSGHIPAGMELFSAGDESQMSVIKRWIDESDVYLLILGGRYGSIEPVTGKSYTHLEFEYALERKKPLFAVVISDEALQIKVKIEGTPVIEQNNYRALTDFKGLVTKNLVKFWDDVKDIKLAIHETISDFDYRKELVGWIRGDNLVNAGFLAEEIARLTKENSELRSKLLEIDSTIGSNYAGLSYLKMKELLVAETFKDPYSSEETTLFDYFIKRGELFSKGSQVTREERQYHDKLILFKLIQVKFVEPPAEIDFGGPFAQYLFTEDGQHFYLKSISLAKT